MNLTQIAYWTRKIIKYGTFFIIFLIIGRIAWGIGWQVYKKVFPPAPPAPTVEFGRLPVLAAPKKEVADNLSFVLQTPTNELPVLPTVANVYFMPQAQSSFLNLEEAEKIADSLGFSGNNRAISETIYRFDHRDAPGNVEINIINKTFSINYNVTQTPDMLNLHPRSTEEALSATQSLLARANLLAEDLKDGQKTFDFLKAEPPNLVGAISLSEANFVRVNFFRASFDDLPVLTPEKTQANVWFLVSGDNSTGKQIIAGEYHYFPVDKSNASTYPLKTAQTAWDELVAGKSFIAQKPQDNEGNKVTIRKVYLGYYDSGLPQGFLQPIVVFEGDAGFTAYVPAVTQEYYGAE